MEQFLPTATPESFGVSRRSVTAFAKAMCQSKENQETHGFLLIRHGKLLAEGYFAPYHKEKEHTLFSVSKSFTSVAIGYLVDEGKISVEDRIADYFPEKIVDGIFEENKEIRLKDLLSMSVGQKGGAVHERQTAAETSGVMLDDFFFRKKDIPCGQEFRYDSFGTYMLSALVSKLTGKSVVDFLQDKLFAPLNIKTPFYVKDSLGISIGYTGMRMRLRDLAKVGLTFLNGGRWEGQQLIPEAWLKEAMQAHISTENCSTGVDWQQGYCYQFWKGRHNTTRLCGAFGQMCVIMPDYDAIFVIQSGFDNDYLSYILDHFYDKIMFRRTEEAREEAPAALQEMEEVLANLSLVFEYSSPSPLAQFVGGQIYPIRPIKDGDGVRFAFTDTGVKVELLQGETVSVSFDAGYTAPVEGYLNTSHFTALEDVDSATILATAAWKGKTRLEITCRFFGFPTILKVEADVAGEDPAVEVYTIRGKCPRK